MRPSEHYLTAQKMIVDIREVDITALDPLALAQVDTIIMRAQAHATLATAVDAYHRTEEGIAQRAADHEKYAAEHAWRPEPTLLTKPARRGRHD